MSFLICPRIVLRRFGNGGPIPQSGHTELMLSHVVVFLMRKCSGIEIFDKDSKFFLVLLAR